MRKIKERIDQIGRDADESDVKQRDLLLSIPNLPHEACPVGHSAEENPEVRHWGKMPEFSFEPKDHTAVAGALGMIDFEAGVKITGSAFVVYKGAGARLERALINFLLDLVAKLHAACRHRSLAEFPIVDVRVFNYFSSTQDISARFFITDLLRAIRDKSFLNSSDYIVRDFLHPADFYRMISALLDAAPTNAAVDCYTLAPIDKPTLLKCMEDEFGLIVETVDSSVGVNATGRKPHYYSLNTRAADFGYAPSLTSLEGVLRETRLLVSGWAVDECSE